MLINAKLPFDLNRLSKEDQTLSLAGMSWVDYEKFDDPEYPGYRVSYFNRVITLVSPSQNHEVIAEVINYLIVAYCKKINLSYYPMRSTRLTNKPLAGKEPDVSFSFSSKKSIPDLAIEVIFSSGSVDDLKTYHSIGVAEVWFWRDSEITFYSLAEQGYIEIAESVFLPNLAAKDLENFVNRGFNESPLTIEADFLNSIT
ncbi:MAG: Uma2 family endonuclease [Pleurocapsa sp.]